MTRKSQLLTYVIVLGIFDAIIPLFPILAIMLIYVMMVKPPWVLEAVQEIYGSK